MSDQEKTELAERNMPLIWYVVNRYTGVPVEFDELYSAALFGMARALSAYEETKGAKFSTFAVVCMNRAILQLLRTAKKRKLDISYDSLIRSSNGDEIWHENFVSATKSGNISPDDVTTKIVIHDFVDKLPERDREILRLRVSGLRQKEISKKLGLSQAQISRILIKMMDELRKELYSR